jgi:hypothetical protein
MTTVSHTAAFRAQAEFPVEAKIKVGASVWPSPETAGARLYELVLSKKPTTVQKVIDLAAELKVPFTAKQVQGHLRWLYTAGQLEVDGKSYTPKTKEPKAPKVAKVKAAKPPKAEAPATAAARKPAPRRTQKLKRAA